MGKYDWWCFVCKEKEDKWAVVITLSFLGLIVAVVLGVRIMWAKYVFDDYRCAFGECRIIKD